MNFEEIFRIANNGKVCSVFPEYTDGLLEQLYGYFGWTDKEVKRSLEGELERVNGNLKEYESYLDDKHQLDPLKVGEAFIGFYLPDEVMIFHEDKEYSSISKVLWSKYIGII